MKDPSSFLHRLTHYIVWEIDLTISRDIQQDRPDIWNRFVRVDSDERCHMLQDQMELVYDTI